jgi:pimeloyl-ACP methyl ester carboxylesterase
MMRHTYPVIPTFLLGYKFDTYQSLKKCKMPIVIFHGDQDEVIYYNSSVKLKEFLKRTDTLITLHGQGHNGITDNPQYIDAISKILN